MGLVGALKEASKKVAALSADGVPDNYRFLPGAKEIMTEPPAWEPGLLIAVDCDGLGRRAGWPGG